MTTTELIKLLKNIEFGASNRPRTISITYDKDKYLFEPNIEILSTGDGICGAEVNLKISKNKHDK
jgi:hypothetical protein